MFCSKCGNQMKEGEQFCSKCGTPVKAGSSPAAPQSQNQGIPPITQGQGIPPITSMTGANTGTGPQGADKKNGTEKLEGAFSKLTQTAGEAAETAFGAATEAAGEVKKAMKDGGKKSLLIVGAVVAVVLVIGILNASRINNFFHRTFSSPEKYYQFVERKTVDELSENVGEWYDSYVLEALNFYDKSVTGELEVELGKDGQELLGLLGLAGVDLSWLQSAAVSGDMAIKNDVLSLEAALRVNKSALLSGNVIMDMGKGSVYAKIPEINSKYVGIDAGSEMEYSDFEPLFELQASGEKLMKAYPNQAKVEKLASRYMELALKQVKDVVISKEELTAEGVSQKCRVLTVTLDSDAAQDIAKAVFEEMKDDKEIKAIITDVINAGDMDVDAADAYEEFQEDIEYILDDLEYITGGDQKIKMKVYVNGKGEIQGRSLNLGDFTVKSIMPEKGSKFGYEMSAKSGGQSVKLSGSGKRSGDKINGDFKIKYNGTSIMDLTVKKLNTEDMKKGRLNGRIEAKLSSQVGKLVGAVPGISAIDDIQLNMDFESSEKSYQCKIGFIYDGQDIGTASLLVKTGNGSKASIPGAGSTVMVEDMDDLVEWLESVDLNNLLTAMQKAGVPSDITDEVEEVGDMLEDASPNELMWMMYYMF